MKNYNTHSVVAFLKTSRVVTCLTVFLFSGFGQYGQYIFWGPPVEAAGSTSKVDLVAILVDNVIYGSIKGDLDWYTNTYIPKSAPGTKSLVIPLSANGFYPTDIQKLLENLYHEGQKGVPSQLVGMMIFGELPLPIVDLKGKRITSIYPYVDFEEPMFRYDPVSDVFISNGHAESVPELWHSIIPTNDVGLITKFFSKLKEYDASPTNYAKPMIWYDDFPMMKNSYSEEERQRYLNTLIFAEVNKEDHYMPMFSRLMNRQYEEDTVEAIKKATNEINALQGPALTDEGIMGDPKAEQAVEGMFQGLNQVLERLDPKEIENNPIESGEKPIPTRLLEKSMQQEFQPNYTMFGNTYLTELQDNVLAGGRYQLEDIDTSLEKVEITERVAKQFVTDMNLILEKGLDTKVEQEVYQLKYPLPYRYTKRKPWYHILNPNAGLQYSKAEIDQLRSTNNDLDKDGIFNHHDTNIDGDAISNVWDTDDDNDGKKDLVDQDVFKNGCGMLWDNNNQLVQVKYDIPFFEKVFGVGGRGGQLLSMPSMKLRQGDFMGGILGGGFFILGGLIQKFGKEVFEYARYENHYFGRNAVDITNYQNLSIYRGSFFNQLRIDELRSLAPTIREKDLDDIPGWKWSDASVGASAGWFAQQVQQNRAFNFNNNALDDKDTYDAMKCNDEQELDQFAYQYWGGASPLNIDSDAFANDVKYPITKVSLTDRGLARNPSVDRQIGGPWYDPSGAILVKNEITKDKLHAIAHKEFGSVIELWKEEKDARLVRAGLGKYDSILDGKINRCDQRKQLDDEAGRSSFDEIEYFYVYEQKKIKNNEWMGITVQPTIGAEEDLDDDRIPNNLDPERDGDRVSDNADFNGLGGGNGGSNGGSNGGGSNGGDQINTFSIQLIKNPPGSVPFDPERKNYDTPVTLIGADSNSTPGPEQIKNISVVESLKTNTDSRRGLGGAKGDNQPVGISNEKLPTNQDYKNKQTRSSFATQSVNTQTQTGLTQSGTNTTLFDTQSVCTYPSLQIAANQNILLDGLGQSSTLSNQFQKEYLVVDMSLHRCKDCVSSAIAMNSDPDFQARVSGYGSCDFMTLTEDKTLTSWINAIGGANTFVGQRSRQNLSENGVYFDIPKLFGADPLTTTPTFYIINRQGNVVVSREGALPDLFYELCVPECKADIPPPESGQKQAAGGGGCGCGGGSKGPPKSDEEENKITDMTYEVPFNIIGRNIDGDRTANPNDRDMDGDGIANGLDPDTDGDGIINTKDLDIDNDGIANGLDPDIDQDSLENRRDPDADADRVDDKYDDDIDADGIPNTQDPDSDADGEKDADEKDSDKDGKDNAVDKGCGGCGGGCGGGGGGSCNGESRDVDGDQIPNDQDDDIDGDGILNPFDFDMDGDGLANDEDGDIDGDGIPNESDSDMDTDRLVNNQDDDRDSDGELNEFDETPNGYARPFSSPIALQLFGDNCVGQHMDIDNDGYRNDEDYDIDGDGWANWEDPDMDGDGLTNGVDSDVDCDGKNNGDDDDTDMDGVPNSQEGEVDSDGKTNDVDDDIDGDGISNGKDGDVDGDGMGNSIDPDIDGDQIPNHSDPDIDGDGIENKRDLDVDGDGLPNDMKINTGLDMRNENPTSSGNSDAANNNANQSSKNGGSCCGGKSGGCAGGCSKGGQNQAGGQDSDTVDSDEDGLVDSVDSDDDNDGESDSQDSDDDGDGYADDQDSGSGPDTDSDGDGTPNGDDNDIDGDGVDNALDTDDDNDGILDKDDLDADADGKDDIKFPRNALKSKREDRGALCFMMGHDFRYQLINTTVKHTAPVSDETDTMSLMTYERPIDDSRYLAFHGIGGDVVEFIYPDLWNVPIYDCDLLKPDDIIEKINDYLKQKVQIYNQLLEIQLAKAPAHYAKHPAAFDFLETVDIAGTPNRSYDLLPETYFIDLLGEKQIKRLAYLLYVMSVGREQRPQAATIGEFIEKARERFDRNKKQKYVIEEFLKYDDPGDEWKFDKIAYPTHIEKKYAYELGFINSDAYDIIKREKDPLDRDLPPPTLPQFSAAQASVGDKSHTGYSKQTSKSESDDSICGISSQKAVALPKWPKAFSCWLEKTLEKPFDFEIKLEIDMKGWNEADGAIDSLNQQWKSSVSMVSPFRPSPKRMPSEQPGSTDTQRTPLLGASVFANDFSNKFIPAVIENDSNQDKQNDLFYSFSLGLSNQGTFIAGQNSDAFLQLRTNDNNGKLRVSIKADGGVCPQVEGKNLCTQTLLLDSDFQGEGVRLPVRMITNTSGNGRFIAEICSTNTLCTTKELVFSQIAGDTARMSFVVPTDRVIRGGAIPLGVQTVDEFGNTIPFLGEGYTISASGGSFSSEEIITSFSIGGGNDGYTLFYPNDTANSISLTLNNRNSNGGNTVLVSKTLESVIGTWKVADKQNKIIDYLRYRLPHKSIGFFEQSTDGSVTVRDNLPGFSVSVTDLQGGALKTPIQITSLNGLVRVGSLVDGGTRFIDTETYITDGKDPLRISLLPLGKAGIEYIEISAPGMDPYTVEVEILPSGPDELRMNIDSTAVRIGAVTDFTVTLKDSRGNLYTEETNVDLQFWGGIHLIDTGSVDLLSGNTQQGKMKCVGGTCSGSCTAKGGGAGGGGGKCSGGGIKGSQSNGGNQKGNQNGGENDGLGKGDGLGNDGGTDGGTDGGNGDADGNGADDANGVDGEAGSDQNDTGDANKETEDGEGEREDGESNTAGSGICVEKKLDNNTKPPLLRYDQNETYGDFTVQVPETLRPSKPDQDINVMYLNLYGYPRGNSADTLKYLNNTKTLAITTFWQAGGNNAPEEQLTALVFPDGKVNDIAGNMISEITVAGGTVSLQIGHQGGVGSIVYGTHPEFDMLQQGEEFGTRPHKIVYTPNKPDSILKTTSFEDGKIYYNDDIIVDIPRGYLDPRVHIRRSGAGNDRWVTYDNKQIGTLWIKRDGSLPFETTVLHNSYRFDDTAVDASSKGQQGIGIYLQSLLEEGSSGPFFESIEASYDSRKNIGMRHAFKPMTNFSQGMRVGPATQHFGGPYLINFGDPFLQRVKQNRAVQFTDYDAGPGKVVFSDTKTMLDVDTGDLNKDGKTDLIISYKDGSIRILKNYGGGQPYKDLGFIMVIADGLKETFIGDVDGDGWDDIMVSTQSDKLRVYKNNKGEISVDGTIVCLDIPNGDQNVAQVRQLFVDDMDGDKKLDIITNDINGDIKVFYGGNTNGGPNYLSTDQFQCDKDWKGRQKQQLVKSFSTKLGGAISDSSLRHRPELTLQDNTDSDDEGEGPESPVAEPDVKSMSKKQMKQFAKDVMTEKTKKIKEENNPKKLLKEGVKKLDARFEVPDVLRPDSLKGKPGFAGIPANDPLYPQTPRFDAQKTFTDLNGDVLEKGDLVRVDVSLIPVGTAGPVVYRERLDGPWVIYKDAFNTIPTFKKGSIPAGAEIDWNIGQGYQFMISNLPLGGTVSFSYEVQYDGNGYVTIEIETLKKEWFKGPTNQSLAENIFSQAHAGGWVKRIRAYPDEACRKEYRLFSPAEKKVQIDKFLKEKEKKYEEHFEKSRQDLEDKATDPTTEDPIAKALGILPFLKNKTIEDRVKQIVLQGVSGGGLNFELDPDAYLQGFVEKAEEEVESVTKEAAKGAMKFATLGLFPDDYEFTYNKCQGYKFGKKMCGPGSPIPFNTDLLSPGAFQVFGCKITDFKGLPIFAIPAAGIIPFWPINPAQVGGIFGGKVSQFRTFLTWTTSNGLGLSLCFGPYDTLKLPTPIGDVGGNCLVIAGNIGSQCTSVDDDKLVSPKQAITPKEAESKMSLKPEQYAADKISGCNEKEKKSSPFVSPTNGNKQVQIPGNVTENQSLKTQLRSNTWDSNRFGSYVGERAPSIVDAFGGHGGDTFEVDYLKGGVGFQLKIEEGNISGLVKCIFRKWKEKQIAYFANNALNMHISIILPDLEQMFDGWEEGRHISDTPSFKKALNNRADEYKKTQSSGVQGQNIIPEKTKVTKLLPKSILKATSELIQNPFDHVIQFFEQVPLVTVEVRDVPLEVPLIYDEDAVRYAAYIESWLQRNEEILAERGDVDRVDQNALQRMQQAVQNVKRNKITLTQYKALPGKVYALLHASDQYIMTIFQFIDTFVSKLTGWLQDNAMRFSHWVDFIITLKGVIKTRQLLIDFTVNRQDRCSQCRQDNYDYYSCKLKLLCVDLPIIPIPSFRLPNITIDLSNISLGMDLIIPKFSVVPRKMNLFQIPDLPVPSGIALDLAIPTIPLLPPPPALPELPELNIVLDMTLPVLPPAPKVPALSPSIKAVIKLMDVLGKFFCIFKGGIGLVREKFVKARVEQMTQRKGNIMPFDGIKIQLPTSPLQAYDYRVEAGVDVKFDFRVLYELAMDVADEWNSYSNKGVSSVNKVIKSIGTGIVDGLNDTIGGDVIDGLQRGIDGDIFIDLSDARSSDEINDYLVKERGEQRPRLLVGGPVPAVRDFIIDNARYVLDRQDVTWLHPQARSLITEVSQDPQVSPNIEGVREVGKQVTAFIDGYTKELKDTKNLVQNDWDGFLDSIQENRLLSDASVTQTFRIPLFNAEKSFVDQLRATPHPMESYFAMNEVFIDGFLGSLQRHHPEELNMNTLQHENLTNYLEGAKQSTEFARSALPQMVQKPQFGRQEISFERVQEIDGSVVSVVNAEENTVGQEISYPRHKTNTVGVADVQKGKKLSIPLLAQADGGGGEGESTSTKVDFSQFIDGFFVPGKDGNYHNVIDWEVKGNKRYDDHTYNVVDANQDGTLDIVNYDEHQIYIKYGKQKDSYGGGGGGSVLIGPFASAQDLEARVKDTFGRYNAGGTQFKLRSEESVYDEYSREGHTYTSMSFTWENDPRMDGYVLMLTDEQQTSEDKKRDSHNQGDPSRTRYVVLLPEPITATGVDLEIEDLLPATSLQALKKSGKVTDIILYDGQGAQMDVLLQRLERKWYYTKHAPLRLEKQAAGGLAGVFGGTERVLKKVGPRSTQQVAGAQARGDDQIPRVDLELKRDLTGEIIARGPLMQGYINTTYTLKAKWTDNGKVIKNRVVWSGEVVKIEQGEEITLPGIDYENPTEQQLLFVGIDQAGNIGQQEVRLQIAVPELKINEIRYLGVGGEIESELSSTIDRGTIKFEKNRFGIWKPLQPAEYPVKPTDPIVVGGLYPFDDRIVLKDEKGNEIGMIDTKTGEISLHNGGNGNANGGSNNAGGGGSCSLKVVAPSSGKPQIEIYQKQGTSNQEKKIMTVTYTPKTLAKKGVELVNTTNYQLRELGSGYLGKYRQGYCISPQGSECHIFVSKQGDILIPKPWNALYQGTVSYEAGTVIYTLRDTVGNEVVRIHFIIEKI